MANFAQWSKNIPRSPVAPQNCPPLLGMLLLMLEERCLAFGLWLADNKYLQETPRPLISVKKLRPATFAALLLAHKMRARKQFIKVLLLNCRLCGCFWAFVQ